MPMEITDLGLQPTNTAVESQTNATIWSASYLYNFHLLRMLFSDIIGAERGYDRTEYVSWGADASITWSASSCLAYLTYSILLPDYSAAIYQESSLTMRVCDNAKYVYFSGQDV